MAAVVLVLKSGILREKNLPVISAKLNVTGMGLAKAIRGHALSAASPIRAAGEGTHLHVAAEAEQRAGVCMFKSYLLWQDLIRVARKITGLVRKACVMAAVPGWVWCFHAEFVHFWVECQARRQGVYEGNWAALSPFDATGQLSTRQKLLENPPASPQGQGREL